MLASSAHDLKQALGQFATGAVGVRVSTSKSKAMVLCWKTVDCLLWLGDELLPQVRELKYLMVLFTSDRKLEREMDRQFCVVSVQALCRIVMVKKELSRMAKLSIYQPTYVPTLTYGHELWVVTQRMRSQTQAAEMNFLRRMAGFSLRDRVRSSNNTRELGVEQLLLCIKRSQLR